MIKHNIFVLFLIIGVFQSVFASEKVATGLEIDNPNQLYIVYTIVSDKVDKNLVEALVSGRLAATDIKLVQREDAQLFLRIEQHAGEYLLYLDFSRKVYYQAGEQSYYKDGFVWGRYVKDISDVDELYDDVDSVMEEFVEAYINANEFNENKRWCKHH